MADGGKIVSLRRLKDSLFRFGGIKINNLFVTPVGNRFPDQLTVQPIVFTLKTKVSICVDTETGADDIWNVVVEDKK